MKLMRLVTCVAAFAVVGGIALSGDMDIRALQAKLAAQEARLNDLQAKIGSGSSSAPANITSMRKNAKVTIGGEVATRYYYRDAQIETTLVGARNADVKTGHFEIGSAKLNAQIAVNENWDAYLQMDLHDAGSRDNVSGVAQTYWVRYKSICNTGLGILVGRDSLKFGMAAPIGIRDQYNHEQGPEINASWADMGGAAALGANNYGDGMFLGSGLIPNHIGLGQSRTTQITPYWESQDGKIKVEASIFGAVERKNGSDRGIGVYEDGTFHKRSINYGLGSGSLRLTWNPTEEWSFVLGAINMHGNGGKWVSHRQQYDGDIGSGADGFFTANPDMFEKNNYAFHLGAKYTPAAFCQRLTLWANATTEYNAGFVRGQDTYVITAGAMYALTDKLTVFAMGDYLHTKNDLGDTFNKAKGWRSYLGAKYDLGSGLAFETGWIHDKINYKDRAGNKHTTYKGDVLYAHLGFQF